MKNFRTFLFAAVAALTLSATTVNAQVSVDLGADFVSKYIWRGLDLGGTSPHVQPWVEFGFGESGLAIGAWGSYATTVDPNAAVGAEADLYLSYSHDLFGIVLSDYFFPSGGAPDNGYFYWKNDWDNGEVTGHTLELMATYNGVESFPLYATFAINLYGADGSVVDGDKVKPQYAKYLEVGYPFSAGDVSVDVFAGLQLDDPDEEAGDAGWYGDAMGFTNIGLTAAKDVQVTETFALPLSMSVIVNPMVEDIYFVFGISF